MSPTNSNPTELNLLIQAFNICQLCSEPATTVCYFCREGASGDHEHYNTYYCGEECREEDFASHKPVCKRHRERKQLFRAGKLIQRLFYLYHENVFEVNIEKIQAETGEGKTSIWVGRRKAGQIEAEYPRHLINDETTRQVVISWFLGVNAIALMSRTINMFLQGIISRSELGIYDPKSRKNNKHTVTLYDYEGIENTCESPHQILRVTLSDGKRYVLDIASAQYGYPDPVTPWTEYSQRMKKESRTYLPDYTHELLRT